MTEPNPMSKFKSKSGVGRIFAAFTYSIAGFRAVWKNEQAFRQEIILFTPATVIALCLPIVALEKVLLIGVMLLVLMVELINSAIEAIVDRVSLERHPLSKHAKDYGSAAVFLALIFAFITWLVIIWTLIFG